MPPSPPAPALREPTHRLPWVCVLLATLALLAGCGTAPDSPAAAEVPRNLVIIVLDTTRADFLSAYGYPRATTPELDRLAAEGVRYSRAFTTDFWTLPAHASLLTGLYPTESQATSETNHLGDGVLTLAEVLHASGFATYAAIANPWISEERGFSQGFDTFVEAWREERRRGDEDPEQVVTRQAERWIRAASREQRPFFMFFNLNTPHLPYAPPTALREEFLDPGQPLERVRELMHLSGMWGHLGGAISLGPADFEILRDLYAAEIKRVDSQVAEISGALRAAGVLDRTMFVVTADHGENIGDHGMIDHLLSMYDSTTHIPLIVRSPGLFPAGEVVGDLVSLVDILPTVLDALELGDDGNQDYLDEFSLCSTRRRARRFVTAENDRPVNGIELMQQQFPEFDVSTIEHPMRMLRTERHKLIWRKGAGVELYDLESDPAELRNVADAQPAVRDELFDLLQGWMDSLRPRQAPELFESDDPETLERLRSLGYIN